MSARNMDTNGTTECEPVSPIPLNSTAPAHTPVSLCHVVPQIMHLACTPSQLTWPSANGTRKCKPVSPIPSNSTSHLACTLQAISSSTSYPTSCPHLILCPSCLL